MKLTPETYETIIDALDFHAEAIKWSEDTKENKTELKNIITALQEIDTLGTY